MDLQIEGKINIKERWMNRQKEKQIDRKKDRKICSKKDRQKDR